MTVGVIGDVHGDFSTIESIMEDNSEIKCWLCTGDLALYLIGGAAMIKYGLKAATKDIDVLLS